MTEKDILKKIRLIKSNLDDNKYFSAIALLKEVLVNSGLTHLNHKLDREEQTYRYMLHYFMEGYPDNDRDTMLGEIKENILSLSDLALRAIRLKDNPDYYYTILRMSKYKNERPADLIKEYGETMSELTLLDAGGEDTAELRRHREDILECLFNSLLTSMKDDEAYKSLLIYIKSGYADPDVTLLSISAITLSLLIFYDKAKLNLLLDIYDSTELASVEARALIGIIFALNSYPDRIGSDPGLNARLSLWNDSLENYTKIRNAIRMVVSTRDTEIVSSKFKDEVLPELMKLRPEMMDRLKNIETEELEGEGMINNPEWEELLDKSGLTKKMQELSEMQSEGADLMMITFSNLKQFPFFNSASNWFLPFDMENSALHIPDELKPLVELMRESTNIICDSDLYSLALAAPHMPEAQRKMLKTQFGMQLDQLKEQMNGSEISSSTPKFDSEVQKAVRDLYRFFKLFKKKQGFLNPFRKPLEFYNFPIIGTMLRDDDILELIAEYYFKRGFYSDALPLLQLMAVGNEVSPSTWEKIGFCYQNQGDFSEALTAYNNASLLATSSLWLTKKLAFVNRILGNVDDAIEFYEEVLDKEPENIGIMLNVGHLLTEKHQYADALRHYYHALYLSPENPKVIRPIAWAELMSGNFEKSDQYFSKILNSGAKSSDYLNLGHSAFLQKRNKDALNYYRLAYEMNSEKFYSAFTEDIPVLIELGLDNSAIYLMRDLVLEK